MPTASELIAQELQRKQAELVSLCKQHETGQFDQEGGTVYDMPRSVIDEVRTRRAELDELGLKFDAATASEALAKTEQEMEDFSQVRRRIPQPAPHGDRVREFHQALQAEGKTLTQFVMDTKEYQARQRTQYKFGVWLPDFDTKTLFTLAGYAPPNDRSPRVVLSAQRQPVISDVIPTDTTTNDIIKYMLETTFTNNAATVSEAAAKAESALGYTEQSSTVRKIATWIPVTEEALDDVAQLRNLIDNRLTLMLLIQEETQIMSGTGVAPQLLGFYQAGIGAQAQGADSLEDAIFKAMQVCRVTGMAEPTAVLIHPTNWGTIRLAKASTSGEYLWGPPSAVGAQTLWGLPVVQSQAVTLGSPVTGAFTLYSHISRKLGIRIDVSDSHSDYFVANKLAVRAEMRESLEIFRPSAFCQVT